MEVSKDTSDTESKNTPRSARGGKKEEIIKKDASKKKEKKEGKKEGGKKDSKKQQQEQKRIADAVALWAGEEEENKDDLNAHLRKGKGKREPRAKPLKIGFLFVVEGKLKKTFKYRFCILTQASELDWFRKQEDQVNNKRAGYLKLTSCDVEETPDQMGQPWCFAININGKSHYFAADTEQDRLNWMVEIIKLRGVPKVIALLENSRLSKHAATALGNLAGKKDGSVQEDIVNYGGVQKLLDWMNTHDPDEKLVDVIYYAMTKLAVKDANKRPLADHFPVLFDLLLNSQNQRWRDFSAQTIALCCENDENKELIIDRLEGFPLVIAGPSGDNLKLRAIAILLLCSSNERLKLLLVTQYLKAISDPIGSFSPSVQESLLNLVNTLSEEESLREKIVELELMPKVLPLLISNNDKVQDQAAKTAATFTGHDPTGANRQAIIDNDGLPNLVSALSSTQQSVLENTLVTLLNFVERNETNAIALASLQTELLPLIMFLTTESPVLLDHVLKILIHLSKYPTTRSKLCADLSSIQAILKGLTHSFTKEEAKCMSAEILAHVSHEDVVKIEFCKYDSLLTEPLALLSNPSEDIIFAHAATILSNVSNQLVAVFRILAKSGQVGDIVKALAQSNDNTVRKCIAVALADIALVAQGSHAVVKSNGVSVLEQNFSRGDSLLSAATARALANMAYHDDFQITPRIAEALVELVGKGTSTVRETACRALRNSTHNNASVVKTVKACGIDVLVKTLSCKDPILQEHLCVTLRNCLAQDDSLAQKGGQIIPQILAVINSSPQVRLAEHAVSVLGFCDKQRSNQALIMKDFEALFKLLLESSGRLKMMIARTLSNCMQDAANHHVLQGDILGKVFGLLQTPNGMVVRAIASIIYNLSRSKKFHNDVAKRIKPFVRFLNHPDHHVKQYLAGILINSAINDKAEVILKDFSALSCLRLLSRLPEVEISQQPYKLKLDRQKAQLIPANTSFSFQSDDAMRYHIAKALALCYYGVSLVPVETQAPGQRGGTWAKGTSPSGSHEDKDSQQAGTLAASDPLIGGRRKGSSITVGTRPRKKTISEFRTHYSHDQFKAICHYRVFLRERIASLSPVILSYLRNTFVKRNESVRVGNLKRKWSVFGKNARFDSSLNTVSYVGRDLSIPGTFQADIPFRRDACFAYFEVLVVQAGKRGSIGVGLAEQNYPLDQQPGWKAGSYGYHGDDGNKYHNEEHDLFGPSFTTGDVIGCGYNNVTGAIFFTKNGKLLGEAFQTAPPLLYPTVGLASPGEVVFANFGEFPFLFEFDFTAKLKFNPAPKAVCNEEKAPTETETLTGEVGRSFDDYMSTLAFLRAFRE